MELDTSTVTYTSLSQ